MKIGKILSLLLVLFIISACDVQLSTAKNLPFKIIPLSETPATVKSKALHLKKRGVSSERVHTNNRTYIIISSEKKESSGYSIHVRRVTKEKDKVTIYAKDVQPKKEAFTSQVITTPIVCIALSSMEIKSTRIVWE